MNYLLKVLLLLSLSANVLGSDQSAEIAKEVSDNISSEYAQCAAFFMVSNGALERAGKTELAERYKKIQDRAVEYALIAARKGGRSEEMAQKVTLARLEIGTKRMLGEIDNDGSNISILLNKYATRCTSIMEQPERMMKEWLDQAMKKYFKADERSKPKNQTR